MRENDISKFFFQVFFKTFAKIFFHLKHSKEDFLGGTLVRARWQALIYLFAITCNTAVPGSSFQQFLSIALIQMNYDWKHSWVKGDGRGVGCVLNKLPSPTQNFFNFNPCESMRQNIQNDNNNKTVGQKAQQSVILFNVERWNVARWNVERWNVARWNVKYKMSQDEVLQDEMSQDEM